MVDSAPGVLVELQQPVRMSSLRNCPSDRVGRKVVLGFSWDEIVDLGILVPKIEATLARVGGSVVPLFALNAAQAEEVLASVTLKEPPLALDLLVIVQVAIKELRSELDDLASLESPVDGPPGSRRNRIDKTLAAAARLQRSFDRLTHGDLARLEEVSEFDRQRFHDCAGEIAQLVEILKRWTSFPLPPGRPSRYWEIEFVRQLKDGFERACGVAAARTWADAPRADYQGPFERLVSAVVDAAGLKTFVQTSLEHLIRSALKPEAEIPSVRS